MKKIIKTVSVFLIAAAFVSCSSKNYDQEMKVAEDKFYKGEYLDAARLLLPNVNKAGKDSLLFMMECGTMLNAGGDYKNSNKLMIEAGKIAKVIPVSVTQQAASFLTNDTNTNYRGEDFEKVLVHVYAGINFLMLKEYDDARVEFTAVNNELAKIKTENGESRYKQNIMAKYLTAIAYEIIGYRDNDSKDLEFAYIEYKQIYALDPEIAMVKDDLLRLSKRLGYDEDLQEWQKTFSRTYREDPNTGELISILQNGRGAVKKSRGPILKDQHMGPAIRLTLQTTSLTAGLTVAAVLIALNNVENPIARFEKRTNKVDKMHVEAKGGKITGATTKLEDVEATEIKNLEDDYGYLYKRVAASIVTKAAASLAAGLIAKQVAEQFKKSKGFASLIGTAVGAGTGVALFAQMKPDLRCWHTLPANFQLSRMALKPGKQKVSFVYLDNGGIIERIEKEVEIKKGEKTVVNLRTLY